MPRIVPTLPGFLTIVLAGVLAPSLVQASCAPASGVMASVAVFVGTQAAPVAATQVADLRNKAAGNDKFEDLLNEVLQNTDKIAQLSKEVGKDSDE